MNISTPDRLRLGALGLRSRPGRTALSALGIAIGITAMVGVLGMAESSRADLNRQLEKFGTNLLTVSPGQSFTGAEAPLPDESPAMVDRMATVEAASAVRSINATVRKNHLVPEVQTSGLSVAAADLDLLETLRATMASGRWLDQTASDGRTAVLGSTAARRLAIDESAVQQGVRVWIDGQWFAVVGILDPIPLASELDDTVLVGNGVATAVWGEDLPPSTIFVRADASQVTKAADLLARTANPADPSETSVSRPSDALEAQEAADQAFTYLMLGLGGVALLVGAIGIANTMVISVLERRREIGVRRALGATRTGIASQFLTESVLLALIGGAIGALLGVLVAGAFASYLGWALVIPWQPIGLGLFAACLIGTLVGLYPAARAAAVPPTEALRSV